MAKPSKNKKGIGNPDDKQKALELLRGDLEKEYGKGVVVTGNQDEYFKIDRIPSGSIGLDIALNGGYPRGRIIEIAGSESAGKSSLCLHVAAECQKLGGTCAYIDFENALDMEYAKNLGVDVSSLLISQPDFGEQGLQLLEKFIRSGAVDLIIVDSVAAITPQSEINGEIGDSHMSLQARLLGQTMRIITKAANQTNTTVIFVNQYRSSMNMYGPQNTTCGGNALKYYASQRLDIKRIEILEDNTEKTGIRSRVKITKNKVGAPFREAEFNIIFGQGIDYYTDLLDTSTQENIINKGGAWYSYNGIQIGQGSVKAANYLKNNLEMSAEIRSKLLKKSINQQPNLEEMMENSEDGEN